MEKQPVATLRRKSVGETKVSFAHLTNLSGSTLEPELERAKGKGTRDRRKQRVKL